MKKSIILSNSNNGQITALEQIMRGALSFGFGISKRVIIFNSKKEAEEAIKDHPCRKGCKVYTLNEKQTQTAEEIKRARKPLYIRLTDFLKIK